MKTDQTSSLHLDVASVADLEIHLPDALAGLLEHEIADWQKIDGTRRLWGRDATLWTGGNEDIWLGWLDAADTGIDRLPLLASFARDVFEGNFTDVLLLGMGGSSLGPEVVGKTFGLQPGWPTLHVIDSTDPRQIRAIDDQLDYETTLFIVSSKSGNTLEVSILLDHFLSRAHRLLGPARAKRHFVVITDPGSKLESIAKTTGFGHIFFGEPTVGGRFSVLSPFGLVPGAATGVDLARYLETARSALPVFQEAAASANPAVLLGLVLAAAVAAGRDKLTILAGPGLESFGGWAEQLVAESTGKNGKAVIPIDAEPVAADAVYGEDRLFFHLLFRDRPDPDQAKIDALVAAGQPLLRITLDDPFQLAQEFLRWEVATAVVGARLGVHPFDQPDVEASKIETKVIVSAYGETGKLAGWPSFHTEAGIAFIADAANKAALSGADDAAAILRAHFARLHPKDYLALLAYLPHQDAVIAPLQTIRTRLRDHFHVATCLQFGPRFLHSTGQAYKGGPNSGMFIQITCEEPEDLAVPGQKYSFGTVKAAQAQGDAQVLADRGRRLLRIHLGRDLDSGLALLAKLIEKAMA